MKYKIYLPTYQECLDIVSKYENFNFYMVSQYVDGVRIDMLNYRMVEYIDLVFPFGNDISATELRGLTFVHQPDGTIKRYLLMEKFFNLGQTPCSLYEVVKDKEIDNVMVKEDGSVISFIMLPNGKIIARTKMSTGLAWQAGNAQAIFDKDTNLQRVVRELLNKDIIPIFEFCSPQNRIVVEYRKEELILLKLRNNITGKYVRFEDCGIDLSGIKLGNFVENETLESLLEKAKTIKFEGWVVQFKDGQMVKIKGQEYTKLHGLVTNELNRENIVINLLLNEKLDDIKANLLGRTDIIENLDRLESLIFDEVKKVSFEIMKLASLYKGEAKEFALKYRKEKYFDAALKHAIGKREAITSAKMLIEKETNRLMEARDWMKKRNMELFKVENDD